MASKQPFKFIDIAQKLTTWSIRINKFVKHRLLSKRKNVLLIDQSYASNNTQNQILDSFHQKGLRLVLNAESNKLIRSEMINNYSISQFERSLLKNLLKTWQITKLQSVNISSLDLLQYMKLNSKDVKSQKQNLQQDEQQNNSHFTKISIPSFIDKQSHQVLQKYYLEKKKYFDSIIVMPQSILQQKQQEIYPQIDDQRFATDFIQVFEKKIMKNVMAYRLAHKLLTTSGTFIQSVSEYDFLKNNKQNEQKKVQGDAKPIAQNESSKKKKQENQAEDFRYVQKRPSASKQIIDSTLCYMGVTIGDRDYTDLNSWTLVSLSEQASQKNPEYIAKMYYDWADSQNLPMPGSFTLFKKKYFKNTQKQLNYVQYL